MNRNWVVAGASRVAERIDALAEPEAKWLGTMDETRRNTTQRSRIGCGAEVHT